MMKPQVLLVFTLIAFSLAQSNYQKLYFGVITNEGSTLPEDQEIIEAQKYAIETFNEKIRGRSPGGLLLVNATKQNTTYEIEWLKVNDSADPNISLQNTMNFCNVNATTYNDTKFIFYSSNKNASEAALLYLDNNCTKQIGISASGFTYNFFVNRTRLFSVPPLLDSQLDTILPFIKFNLNLEQRSDTRARVTLLYTDEFYYREVCLGLNNAEKMETYNYQLTEPIVISPKPQNFYMSAHKLLNINTNIANNTDVLIVCTPEETGISVLNFLQANKIDYDLVGVTPTSPAYFTAENLSYLDYVMWVDDYVPEMDYNVGDKFWYNTAAEFDREHFNKTGKSASPHAYRMLYSYIIAYSALEFSKTNEYDDILFSLTRTSINTIVGLLSFDGFHRTNLQTNVLQTYHNVSRIFNKKVVGPPLVAVAEPILPMPKYEERVYTGELGVAEYVVLAVSLTFIVISVVSGIIIVVKRNNPILRAAAPLFMLGIIAGSIFVYIGAILYGYHGLSKATCILRVWFLALGFILMFGCLFAKSFRVWRLWSANLSKTTDIISDKYLVTIVGVLAAVQVVFLIIYTAAGQPEWDILVVDQYRPSLNQEKCVYKALADGKVNYVGPAFIIVMVVYSFILMGFGLFLSWRTRKVPFLAYNESRVILFSMYNVAFFCLLALIVIANAHQMPVQTEFILHSICILLSAFLTIAIAVGNKFYLMSQGKNSRSKANRSTTGGSTSTNKSDLEKSKFITKEEYEAKLKENEQLKLQLKNLEQQQIEQLEEE